MQALVVTVNDNEIVISLCPDRETEYEVFLRKAPSFSSKPYELSVFEQGEKGKLTVVTIP